MPLSLDHQPLARTGAACAALACAPLAVAGAYSFYGYWFSRLRA